MRLMLRPERIPQSVPGGYSSVRGHQRVVVIGGGLAGVSAAVALAERGVSVTLVEKRNELGGRLAAWTESFRSGETYQMERGFHAFFRQYYNLRSFLRRIDPELSFLTPVADYPIISPGGARESFAGLSRQPPLNVMGLVARTQTLTLRSLVGVNARAALEMLRYDPKRTYAEFDHISAKEYLDSLGFPPKARQILFDVFAHSFFNPEHSMSAAELIMMFHFYFMGNPEGLLFDVCNEAFSDCIWRPFERYLSDLGVDVRFGTQASRIEPIEEKERWSVFLDNNEQAEGDAVVVALNVEPLKNIVTNSTKIRNDEWRKQINGLESASPFAVWRMWLDRPVRHDREPFVGTTGPGILDNISVYSRFQGESRRWAYRTGGSVVELHAYCIEDGQAAESVRNQLREAMFLHYPETRNARVVHESFLYENDCPAFGRGSYDRRPVTTTPHPTLVLAGDFVRVPVPSALMERSVASGFIAANHLLARWNVTPHDIWSVPCRGILA